MAKKVTRTWINKSGQVVTKTYEYNSRRYSHTRGGTLIYKSGKINEKKIQEMEEALRFERGDVGVSEFRAELRTFKKHQFKTMRLTVTSMLARMAATKIESTIRNFGYTPEELAVELGGKYNEEITIDYLLNDANWQGKFFITPSGNRVEFEFDYHGGVLADV